MEHRQLGQLPPFSRFRRWGFTNFFFVFYDRKLAK
jgi:hypothetical protein